jgi:hypothetical protein
MKFEGVNVTGPPSVVDDASDAASDVEPLLVPLEVPLELPLDIPLELPLDVPLELPLEVPLDALSGVDVSSPVPASLVDPLDELPHACASTAKRAPVPVTPITDARCLFDMNEPPRGCLSPVLDGEANLTM